jgi:Carboxypeptidase regulatory-like domain
MNLQRCHFWLSRSLMAFFIFALPLALPAQQSMRGSIEGRVLNALNGQPVAGAQVSAASGPAGLSGIVAGTLSAGAINPIPPQGATVIRATSSAGTIPSSGPTITTGNDGKFSFTDLGPGTYRIMASANGYAPQQYGQLGPNLLGPPITITAAGEQINNIVIALSPAAAVTGRITDENGQPAVDVPVQLLHVLYNPQGKIFQPITTSTANDRGEYRLYGIPPGRYYLVAGSGPNLLGALAIARPPTLNRTPPVTYAVTYYPGVTELNQSSVIQLSAGAEVVANMRVARQNLYRVRGRVIDSRTGQPPAAVSITLTYRTLTGSGGSLNFARNYDPASGNFEIPNVIPGQYSIEARFGDAQGRPLPPTALPEGPSAQMSINVTGDIEGLVLALADPVSITGRVTIEGAVTAPPNLDRMRVSIRPGGLGLPPLGLSAPRPSQVAADGTFRIDGLREGEYIFNVTGLPAGLYLQRADFGGADILNDVFKFSQGSSGTVNVVLRSGAGQLNGIVIDAKNQPVASAVVALIPVQRNRTDIYRTSITGGNGSFAITGITPGDYSLFAWEAMEPNSYRDPDVLRQYESKGRSVRIADASNQTIELRVISAQ